MPKDRIVSRRLWLTQAAIITAAAGMPPLVSSASSAQGKAGKSVVHYRDYPKGRQMCGMCKFFEGRGMMSGECEVVEGRISPMGWCDLYARRTA